MFKYEIMFLLIDYLINEQKTKIICDINFNVLDKYYKVFVSVYYMNNIHHKNRYIENTTYNKFLLNIALTNKQMLFYI